MLCKAQAATDKHAKGFDAADHFIGFPTDAAYTSA